MFGTYRTVLALLVVLQHLGGIEVIGTYAVFGFYILSGYLMTAIMHQSYGYTATGVSRYALNRFLRVYPIYWVSALFTLALIYLFGSQALGDYHEAMRYPATLNEVIKNSLILFPDLSSARLTPPAWALTVELFFYVLIGVGLSRCFRAVVVWFVVSLIYHVTAALQSFPWSDTYFSVAAASLPFSTGALIFFQRERLRHWLEGRETPIVVLLATAFVANYLVVDTFTSRPFGFYSSYVICAMMVASLSLVSASQRWLSVDKWLGDLSYLIYLTHFQAGFLVIWLAGSVGVALDKDNLMFFALSVPLILVISLVMSHVLQIPIDSVRSMIKHKNPTSAVRSVRTTGPAAMVASCTSKLEK